MAKADTASARAPRGSKPVSQAFFTALDSVPEIRRAEIAKAAQIMIRDELKLRRDKAKAAALSAKQARKPATRVARTPKPVAAVKAPAVKTPTVKTPAVAKPVTAAKKTPRTPRRQPASEPTV